MGLASVLLAFRLTGLSHFPTLKGYNMGVKVGQLVLVLPCLFLALGVGRIWWYQVLCLRLGQV